MAKSKKPTRIAAGVCVQETRAGERVGTILCATNTETWEVLFDGEEKAEEKKSRGALKIYAEAYRKPASTPAAKQTGLSVRVEPPKTGRGRRECADTSIEVELDENSSAKETQLCRGRSCFRSGSHQARTPSQSSIESSSDSNSACTPEFVDHKPVSDSEPSIEVIPKEKKK